ncbi:MAG: ABC-2 family transporter protein [Bdellovibrionota bacterium]
MNFISFLVTLILTNIKSTISLRASFVLQSIFMAINNLIFFSMWWIFFGKFEDINGWRLSEIEAMYGFAAGSFGLAVIFGDGVREIARKIIDGSLDTYLVQPKNILIQAVVAKSNASGWGDLVTAIILLALSGYLTWKNLPIIIILHIAATLIFLSVGIISQSLAFWLGPIEHLAREIFEFVLTFSVYPQTIFPSAFKVLLFTVIPAGFVGYLPVEVVKNFSIPFLIVCVIAAAIYLLIAVYVFSVGLRRYESGNKIGV